ncbi:hypothetical protein [Actinomadura hibisca]|uniref:hypothetical protein n=1 Tax=Actinomadura hibisca TaxID=68565 RepID=UPI00083211DF|nr:hypothetical protein [Actinomadura hibisca]
MPKTVKAVRILMFVVAGITFVTTLAFMITVGVSAASFGAAVWAVFPGVLSLVLALRIPQGSKGLRRGIIALEIFYILLSFSRLGQGDPRGLTNMVLPIAILILVFRSEVKEYFAGRTAASSNSYF